MRVAFPSIFLAWLILVMASPALGESVIWRTMPNGVESQAKYWPGEPDKPAVLIVHGFLQTLEFPTVARLARSLADEGYPVLTPNISYGIPRRSQSMACEAIHDHRIGESAQELTVWLNWLRAQGHARASLVAHSFGIYQALGLGRPSDQPEDGLRQLILVSLIDPDVDHQRPEIQAQITLAKQRAELPGAQLHRYRLAFCEEYLATPRGYLSQADWSSERVLALLQANPYPIQVILGGSDIRVTPAWTAALDDAGVPVRVIEGANHFFDAEHEFDLLDEVLALLAGDSN